MEDKEILAQMVFQVHQELQVTLEQVDQLDQVESLDQRSPA